MFSAYIVSNNAQISSAGDRIPCKHSKLPSEELVF